MFFRSTILLFTILTVLVACNNLSSFKQQQQLAIKNDSMALTSDSATEEKNVTAVEGIGILRLDPNYEMTKLNLYNVDSSIWMTYVYNDTFDNDSIRAYSMKPDNIFLVFRCLQRAGNMYKIVVNEQTQEVKYISVNAGEFAFQSWGKYLMDVFAVEFNQTKNPLRTNPSDTATIIKTRHQAKDSEDPIFFHPIKYKNNWLEVETDSGIKGWIKYIDDNHLAVTIFNEA
ncbi:hypothetical protein DVR12_27430 [Chitinophaga silvatica]|uniref:SH3 domain-containing protein n=1 Tax=Chitinophaga silvatica TaxID=2282649 RepID=A0A3E1Y296_9BACT|nr:hypothetical protein [Chitinophaga silvatica]RFS18647.1 hypothetical protein DVR12_27430 [Chitinophaga silvatica]